MCNSHASQPPSADGGAAQAESSFYVSETDTALDGAPSAGIPDFTSTLNSPESSYNLSFTQNYLPSKNTNDGLRPPMDYTQCATNIYSNYADSYPPSSYSSTSNSPRIVEQCATFS